MENICMKTRLSMEEFMQQFDGFPHGYFMGEQAPPETHEELVGFIGQKLGLSDEETSLDGLKRWLAGKNTPEGSCSPEIDTLHAETVVLIGQLRNPDAFVSMLPAFHDSLFLPPPDGVQALIEE